MKNLLFLTTTLMCYSLYADKPTSKNNKTQSTCSLNQADFERGDTPLTDCPSAYNMPAQVHLEGRDYQGFITASYLYWNAQQEGMDLATTATYNSVSNTITKSGITSKTLIQDFDYNSGFKVGLGCHFEHCDNWALRADYTRLHLTTNTSKSAPSESSKGNALYLTDWFFQASNINQNPAAEHLHSSWNLNLDWLDVSISRALYQGKRFTATPFAGLRSSWISQSLNLKLSDVLNFLPPFSTTNSHNRLCSWGIGPRMGLDAHFLIGAGFRLQGEIGASLLFTKYSGISHSEDPLALGGNKIEYKLNGYTCLRTMMESNLGIGWGRYFSKNRYHIDLSATYDFNYLWGQNMMRTLNDIHIIGSSSSAYDLSLQGLTLSAAFHF